MSSAKHLRERSASPKSVRERPLRAPASYILNVSRSLVSIAPFQSESCFQPELQRRESGSGSGVRGRGKVRHFRRRLRPPLPGLRLRERGPRLNFVSGLLTLF